MKYIVILLIKIYRKYISIIKIRQTCRFYPSCSEYAQTALQKHGFFKGVLLSIGRLLRCNPLSAGGYDPVK